MTSHRQLLQHIFEERGTFVLARLRLLGVPEDELEDAAQEVFLVVCQRVHDYEERGQLLAWLRSICVRVALGRRRSRQRRREDLVEVLELEVAPTQHDELVDHEALAFSYHVLQRLPIEQRDIFMSYVVEEKRMPEIARAANCPLQTAYSRLYSAQSRIFAAVKARGRALAL